MLSVVTWRWGALFEPHYVNRLRSMLQRNLRVPHQLWCIGPDTAGIDGAVRCIPGPQEFDPFRCRRRLWQFAKERRALFGTRILVIDLDVVIIDDVTPLIDRSEPVVCWRVGYAGVYSGSFILCDTGALDGAWLAYQQATIAPREVRWSDQAMLNAWLRTQPPIAEWTERDGLVTWFGNGYEHKAHHGMSAATPEPPAGTRIVVMGSADKAVLDEQRYTWVKKHWR